MACMHVPVCLSVSILNSGGYGMLALWNLIHSIVTKNMLQLQQSMYSLKVIVPLKGSSPSAWIALSLSVKMLFVLKLISFSCNTRSESNTGTKGPNCNGVLQVVSVTSKEYTL